MDNPESILKEIKNRHVLVIGDAIVDVMTDVERVKDSEDGTPVYRKVIDMGSPRDFISLGGAALVVRNLVELGARVDFITGFGWGPGANATNRLVGVPGLTVHSVHMEKPHPVKHRYRTTAGAKVFQVDQTDNGPLHEDGRIAVLELFDMLTGRVGFGGKPVEIVVVADYRHGLISQPMAEHFATRYPKDPPLLVSSQASQEPANHRWYRGAPVYVLNEIEAAQILPRADDQQDADYVEQLRADLDASTLIVTLGEKGCLSADDLVGGHRTLAFRTDLPILDTCGAGDAFVAAYAVTGMLSFANMWAGLSCVVNGPNPPTKELLKNYESRRKDRDVAHESRREGNLLGEDRDGATGPGCHETHLHEQGFAKFP